MRGRRPRISGKPDQLKKTHKKSWRFVAELHQCELCGKSFETARGVFGHLRHHSGKRMKRSISAEEECLQDSEGDSLKRARTTMSQNSSLDRHSDSAADEKSDDKEEVEDIGLFVPKGARAVAQNPTLDRPSDSVADEDDDKEEVEEAAMILMMMSSGVMVMDCDVLALNRPAAAGSGTHTTDWGTGFYPVLECELSGSSENEEIKERRGVFWNHKCRICEKTFDSHQALGGHQTFHRMQSSRVMKSEEEMRRKKEQEQEQHKCSVCFKVFASGRALGGHIKCHRSLGGQKVGLSCCSL